MDFLHCFQFLKCCIKIYFSSTSEFLRHPLHVDGVPGLPAPRPSSALDWADLGPAGRFASVNRGRGLKNHGPPTPTPYKGAD